MAGFNQSVNTTNFAKINIDLSELALGNNRSDKGTFTAGGSAVTLAQGTVLGRISANGLLVPAVAAATDGSNIPVGVLATNYIVAANASVALTYYIAGDIDATKLVFNGSETLDTVTSGARYRDHLSGAKGNFILKTPINNTNYDNQ